MQWIPFSVFQILFTDVWWESLNEESVRHTASTYVVDKVALGQVLSEYSGFPCQFWIHGLLHHLSSGAGTIDQLVGRRTKWRLSHLTPKKLKKTVVTSWLEGPQTTTASWKTDACSSLSFVFCHHFLVFTTRKLFLTSSSHLSLGFPFFIVLWVALKSFLTRPRLINSNANHLLPLTSATRLRILYNFLCSWLVTFLLRQLLFHASPPKCSFRTSLTQLYPLPSWTTFQIHTPHLVLALLPRVFDF